MKILENIANFSRKYLHLPTTHTQPAAREVDNDIMAVLANGKEKREIGQTVTTTKNVAFYFLFLFFESALQILRCLISHLTF